MAIQVGDLLEIAVDGVNGGTQVMNVFQYAVDTSAPTISAEQVGEAWWSHVKATYRSVATTYYDGLFRSVSVRMLNDNTGPFGTYAIPLAEQGGTRSMGASPQGMPPFCAVGIRLNVGTRVTRGGSKRLVGLLESDQDNGLVSSPVITAAQAWADFMISSMTLGAPAATMTLTPVVTRKDAAGTVTAHQSITSASVGLYVTTQNSRKYRRGA
jgi:hypothetical protein